jgi:large subunit ribosomal protein L17
MRHGNKVNHLGRTYAHRKSLLKNMANSLIAHKRIQTTLAKAKELRKYVEPIITKSKDDTMHSRRTVFAYLQNKDAVKELFTEIAPRVATRPGGYTRILKLGIRQGDNAEMALIELVDYNEYLGGAGVASGEKKTASRRRRGTKKKGEGSKAEAKAEAGADEAKKEKKAPAKPKKESK